MKAAFILSLTISLFSFLALSVGAESQSSPQVGSYLEPENAPNVWTVESLPLKMGTAEQDFMTLKGHIGTAPAQYSLELRTRERDANGRRSPFTLLVDGTALTTLQAQTDSKEIMFPYRMVYANFRVDRKSLEKLVAGVPIEARWNNQILKISPPVAIFSAFIEQCDEEDEERQSSIGNKTRADSIHLKRETNLTKLKLARDRREAFIAAHPTLAANRKHEIRQADVTLGMTTAEVAAAIGEPVSKQPASDAKRMSWTYGTGVNARTLVFENEVLISKR